MLSDEVEPDCESANSVHADVEHYAPPDHGVHSKEDISGAKCDVDGALQPQTRKVDEMLSGDALLVDFKTSSESGM